eukprot:Platyproteum_vivax@DN6258_c0_g1_i1.p1
MNLLLLVGVLSLASFCRAYKANNNLAALAVSTDNKEPPLRDSKKFQHEFRENAGHNWHALVGALAATVDLVPVTKPLIDLNVPTASNLASIYTMLAIAEKGNFVQRKVTEETQKDKSADEAWTEVKDKRSPLLYALVLTDESLQYFDLNMTPPQVFVRVVRIKTLDDFDGDLIGLTLAKMYEASNMANWFIQGGVSDHLTKSAKNAKDLPKPKQLKDGLKDLKDKIAKNEKTISAKQALASTMLFEDEKTRTYLHALRLARSATLERMKVENDSEDGIKMVESLDHLVKTEEAYVPEAYTRHLNFVIGSLRHDEKHKPKETSTEVISEGDVSAADGDKKRTGGKEVKKSDLEIQVEKFCKPVTSAWLTKFGRLFLRLFNTGILAWAPECRDLDLTDAVLATEKATKARIKSYDQKPNEEVAITDLEENKE